MAILSVVRRDHFSPVMGSPAVSYSSRNSISVTMSAVFFRRVCVRRRSGAYGQRIYSDRAVADVPIWIAGGVVFQQELDQRDDVGGFFSTGLRPPPERRVRPADIF